MKYMYTAYFIPEEDGSGYYARVPDIPGCFTTGQDLSDAIDQITDAASIMLVDLEDDHPEDIPAPTAQVNLDYPDGAILSMIQVDTLAYRAQIDTRAVRKNVSLPAWMFNLADKRGINCSQVLQEALLQKFA
ncbi:MAG: type II toxin-antitoxin system HicB family antitoxin [Eubacteriales bacterium]|nr:type II toxin-antitoxin system HicB family antitoxin [Eubacteriales bacterium]